jgi:hypothetical protein
MRYKVTKKDFYRAYLLHIKPRRIYAILGIILICIALSVCLCSVLPIGGASDIMFAVKLFLGIIFVLYQYFYLILPKTNNDLINAANTIVEKYKEINPTKNNN